MDFIDYVVTLKNKDDLESFYQDMETPGGNSYIPNRSVSVTLRRPISRNTVYKLTKEEADNLKNDPRVLAVSPVELELAAITPFWKQNTTFSRSTSTFSTSWNQWGLYRTTLEENIPNWGDSTNELQTSTVVVTAGGKNVDVILIDGHVNPLLSELKTNVDGTGNNRINLFNWFTLNSIVTSINDDTSVSPSGTTYFYPPYIDATNSSRTTNNNHGAGVLSVLAGNTNGWARESNIYIINPYSSNINGQINILLLWDYIRAFHMTKQVNPNTKIKNPTICNGSYGQIFTYPNALFGPITKATYRGVTSGNGITPLTSEELIASGIYSENDIATVPFYSPGIAADIEDAISEGIIVVGAAGNSSQKIDVQGGIDYNNTFEATFNGTNFIWYSSRGTTPSAVPGVICVGCLSNESSETKSTFSECGPRIDVYAPGDYIITNQHSDGITNDPRGQGQITVVSGSSLSAPQVTGMLACLLEIYPRFTPEDCLNYIKTISKAGKMTDTGGGTGDLTSLQGSPNRIVYYKKERFVDGITYPNPNFDFRPTSGSVWPRVKIFRYGR